MARKRIVEVSPLKSWADADNALREIAENQITLQNIESEMQRQIIGVKKIAEQDSKPYADRIAKLECDLKEFVEDHRDELGKAKSKTLNFGEVGYRLSTSVSLPKAKEKVEDIIRRLKARGMTDCIVVKEDISKDNLKKYGEDTVNAVGATWMYLFKNYNVKDWISFAEIFGLPLRLGKYQPGASEDDKRALMQALVQLGSDAAGIIPDGSSIQFVNTEKTSSTDLYDRLARYCDEQISKAILGQTLTSDAGNGSYAQSKTHNEVRHGRRRKDEAAAGLR